MSVRTRIRYVDYTCPAGHQFKCVVASRIIDADHYEEFYQPVGLYVELPVPKCPAQDCNFIGETDAAAARAFMVVPAEERFEAWLSPDGEKLAVPPIKGRDMPERYRRAGYIKVEAMNMRDQDRFDRIRARQTGNDVWSEMNYSPASRNEHEQLDYNEDPTSIY